MCFRRPSSRSTPGWPRWLATVVAAVAAVSAVVATVDVVVAVAVVAATEVSKNQIKHPKFCMECVTDILIGGASGGNSLPMGGNRRW